MRKGDQAQREKIKAMLVKHSSEVGLGLRCPTCHQEVDSEGGDLNQRIREAFENAFDPNKNGLTNSVRQTQRNLDESNRKIRNEFENPDSLLRKGAAKVWHEVADPNSFLRQGVRDGVEVAKAIAPLIPKGGALKQKKPRKPNAHAAKVKAYMATHKGVTLAEASKKVSGMY